MQKGTLLHTAFRPVWLGLLALVSAMLTSCAVGPDFVRPQAETSAAYKESAGWKIAEPREEIQRGVWWRAFNDAQLNALEEQVAISNQNVMMAEAQFRQARAVVRANRSGYFPVITANASYGQSFGGFSTRGGTSNAVSSSAAAVGSSGSSSTSIYLLSGDLSWEADVWGRIRRSVEAARAGAQASAADLQSALLSAQTDLAQNYFQLRALDSQLSILDATVGYYQQSLQLTSNRYKAGVASMADVLLAKTQLKTAQAQAIDTRVQRRQLEHAIATLIGKSASSFTIPFSPLRGLPPVLPAGLPSELLERRPDIAAAERRTAAANAQIGVAEAAYFPSLTLAASGGFVGTSLSNLLNWSNRIWSVGPALAETIFDGGLRAAQTEEARAAYEANVASYRETVLTAFQQVEDNLAALRILEEEARAQDEAVKASQQSLTVTTNQYKAGIVSYLNVISAQTTALSNERTAADILGRRLTAAVLLIKALGGGWDAATGLPTGKDL